MVTDRVARTLVAGACAAALLASGCTSSGGGSAPPSLASAPPGPSGSAGSATAPLPVRPGDWITYNGGNSRQGVATDELATSGSGTQSSASSSTAPASSAPADTAHPAVAWRATLDGAVYGQPLLLDGRVLAATENDSVYALDQATGRVLWSVHLGSPQPLKGLPCGDINPLGITSTMAYDPATGSLFALAETAGGHHTLYALDPATGAVRWSRAAEPPVGTPLDTQQRGALTVAFGRVYVPYGGLAGDCADYIGSVVGVPASGQGAAAAYHVPTPREGGIWATGGLLVYGTTGLFAAVGNGESTSGFDGSDSVLGLTPALTRSGYFAPTTWAEDNAGDKDLGAMTPALVGGDRVLTVGKSGMAYLLDANALGGLGGELAQQRVCSAFGSAAVRGTTVYVSCRDGVRAVSVAGDKIKVLWSSAAPADGSPTLEGSSVWAVDYATGVLYRFNASTGAVTASVPLGPEPHFASVSIGVGRVYVPALSGVVAVTR